MNEQLQLRHGHQGVDRATAYGRVLVCVDILPRDDEADAGAVQHGEVLTEIPDAPAEAGHVGDQHHVDLLVPGVGEQALEAGVPVAFLARQLVFVAHGIPPPALYESMQIGELDRIVLGASSWALEETLA